MTTLSLEPLLIKGGLAVDDRGSLSFVNDFGFSGVKRFYNISNHEARFVRAWHGHKLEAKYMYAARGSFVVGAVKIDDWKNPNPKQTVSRFVLSAQSPSLLYIPPGYANGLMNLSEDNLLQIFSTTTLIESQGDDYRFPARHWDIWSIEER
jgi:dTDP-4-dehydrorhamnose 3,5-epimerase